MIEEFSFNPKMITVDFQLSNMNAIKDVFKEDTIIVTCMFHLVQCWWREANKLGLRKKRYVAKTKLLIFNLQVLPFLSIEEAKLFYQSIKTSELFNEDAYQPFFAYFDKIWMGKQYPFELWKYSGKIPSINKKGQLIEDDDLDMYVSLSNN